MSPSKHSTAFARQVSKSIAKGRGPDSALRQALARRRLEERREAQMLKQHLFDVLADDTCS